MAKGGKPKKPATDSIDLTIKYRGKTVRAKIAVTGEMGWQRQEACMVANQVLYRVIAGQDPNPHKLDYITTSKD